jgi:hypothetical protein
VTSQSQLSLEAIYRVSFLAECNEKSSGVLKAKRSIGRCRIVPIQPRSLTIADARIQKIPPDLASTLLHYLRVFTNTVRTTITKPIQIRYSLSSRPPFTGPTRINSLFSSLSLTVPCFPFHCRFVAFSNCYYMHFDICFFFGERLRNALNRACYGRRRRAVRSSSRHRKRRPNNLGSRSFRCRLCWWGPSLANVNANANPRHNRLSRSVIHGYRGGLT